MDDLMEEVILNRLNDPFHDLMEVMLNSLLIKHVSANINYKNMVELSDKLFSNFVKTMHFTNGEKFIIL